MDFKIKIASIRSVAVYATILGFWYNLPVISTNIFGGYNEFRLYDFTFLVLILLMLRKHELSNILSALKSDRALRNIFRFSLWASIMTIPTTIFVLIRGNLVYLGMTIMFLYHLWLFVLLAAIIKTYYDKYGRMRLIRWFIFLSSIHLFVYYAQISGTIGHLWPDVYIEAYGEKAFSGTLGPNRITPGMMTMLGFVMSLYVLVRRSALNYLKPLAWLNIALALPAILMIGSRTTFIAMVIFLIVYLVFFNARLIPYSLLLIPLFLLFYNKGLNEKQKERITYNIEYNQNKLLNGEEFNDLSVIEGYQNLGSGRAGIIERYVPFLLKNFYIVPFGSGFNNRIFASQTGAASAHNIYLSLINELGLVGLFFYLSWLGSYIFIERRHKLIGENKRGLGIMTSLVIAMLVSLLAGEHLYVYRPCFAIMGTFIFVATMITMDIEDDVHVESEIIN